MPSEAAGTDSASFLNAFSPMPGLPQLTGFETRTTDLSLPLCAQWLSMSRSSTAWPVWKTLSKFSNLDVSVRKGAEVERPSRGMPRRMRIGSVVPAVKFSRTIEDMRTTPFVPEISNEQGPLASAAGERQRRLAISSSALRTRRTLPPEPSPRASCTWPWNQAEAPSTISTTLEPPWRPPMKRVVPHSLTWVPVPPT